jgi:hypothetical protein
MPKNKIDLNASSLHTHSTVIVDGKLAGMRQSKEDKEGMWQIRSRGPL